MILKNTLRAFTSLLLLFAIHSNASAQNTGTIVCKLFDLEDAVGNVEITLYNQKKGFPEDMETSVETKVVKASTTDGLVVKFENVPFGTYAIAGHHDANANGEMDYNWVGIPKEGYCFSNDAKPVLSPPSYESAKFDLYDDQTVLYIHMQN